MAGLSLGDSVSPRPEGLSRPQTSLDDAFRSLEQLLHVLQGANSPPGESCSDIFSDLGVGTNNPTPGLSANITPRDIRAAATVAAYQMPPSSASTVASDQPARAKTPQFPAGPGAVRRAPTNPSQSYGDISELLSTNMTLFNEINQLDDPNLTSAHAAWHDSTTSIFTEDPPASAPACSSTGRCTGAPPSTAPTLSFTHNLDFSFGGPSNEFPQLFSPREAEMEELKAVWVHEREGLHKLIELQERELTELKAKGNSGRDAGTQCDVEVAPQTLSNAAVDSHDVWVQCDLHHPQASLRHILDHCQEAGVQCNMDFPQPIFQKRRGEYKDVGVLCNMSLQKLDASAQWDATSEPLRCCEDELCRMSALVQAGYEEISNLKRCKEEELEQMRALIGQREEELADLKAEHAVKKAALSRHNDLQEQLKNKEEDVLKLTTDLQSTNWKLKRLQLQQEKEWQDCANFLQHLAQSSSASTLGNSFDLNTAEVLGMGNYGYIITCKSKVSGDRVVVKLQSARWAAVAAKEWAHGSQVCVHDHIVSYLGAFMHKDANLEIQSHLRKGFDTGILTKRRPKSFPSCYFCLALEFMDRGTVQNLLDKHPLPPESVGAISQQVASALAFMHKQKRTHNDIKPENILLRHDPKGGCLIAKLADLGLADHSTERARDHDLFAYTVLCMGLREQFEKCPATTEARESAALRFRKAAPVQKPLQQIWEVLGKVISDAWRGELEMIEVESAPDLKSLRIRLPDSNMEANDLESEAKNDLRKRSMIGWRTNHLRSRRNVHHMMNLRSGSKKRADSEPEEEPDSDVEEEGLAMASTF